MSGDFRNIRGLAAGPTGPIITPNDPYPLLDRKEVRTGTATTPVRGEYYDHDRTIAIAGPVDPVNPASPVYNREQVHNDIGQNAEFLQVINRGTGNLFIRACHEGTMQFADETIIVPGDSKWYVNIYELRCRSPVLGLPYTVTEFYMQKVCCPTTPSTSVSGNIVQISGQAVVTDSGSVTSVSGDIVQVENVSGQSLFVTISGLIVNISGQLVVEISGDIVQISGQAVVTDSGSVTTVSGNIVQVENVSGQFLNVALSGLTIDISGAIIQISGQAVVTDSGSVTSISGNIVFIENASGSILQVFVCCSGLAVEISGQIVEISGQAVITDSGSVTSVSGNIVQVENVSGQLLNVTVSGQPVTTSVSGNIVQISGQAVTTPVPTSVLIGGSGTNPLVVTGASGGVVISSGVVVSVVMKALPVNSGEVYVGGSGNFPFSGFGYILSQGDTLQFDINNFNKVYVVAVISGDKVSFMGTN